jgi:hypothetical protein
VIRWVVSLGLVAGILFLAGALPASGAVPAHSASYYLARGDPRLCPSPLCGGLFAHLVNRRATPCGDSVRRLACYVASLDLSSLGLGEQAQARLERLVADGRALVRGTIVRRRVPGFPQLDVLRASEVWPASSSQSLPTGEFRRFRDHGTRCTNPCLSIDTAMLNSSRHGSVSRVDLHGVGASRAEQRGALQALGRNGLIATGRMAAERHLSRAGRARAFVATQFYVEAAAG